MLIENGIYLIRTDSTSQQRIILYKFHEDYPLVTGEHQLLEPLQYLCSKSEYQKMKDTPNAKLSVDRFWLDQTGSHDKARKAIQKFYTRVQEANQFFYSYKEGWKTDRGMIYIVYGPPTYLQTEQAEEIWYYGDPGNLTTLKFKFIKQNNSISHNDYKLDRSPLYKNSWTLAVSQWRK